MTKPRMTPVPGGASSHIGTAHPFTRDAFTSIVDSDTNGPLMSSGAPTPEDAMTLTLDAHERPIPGPAVRARQPRKADQPLRRAELHFLHHRDPDDPPDGR